MQIRDRKLACHVVSTNDSESVRTRHLSKNKETKPASSYNSSVFSKISFIYFPQDGVHDGVTELRTYKDVSVFQGHVVCAAILFSIEIIRIVCVASNVCKLTVTE